VYNSEIRLFFRGETQLKKKHLILTCTFICLMAASQAFGANYDKKVHKAQSKLKTMGYATGSPDGIMGQNTRKAVKRFQKDKGLPATGTLNSQTLQLILGVSAGIANSSGAQGAKTVVDQALSTAQQLLSNLGYSPGNADGVMGRNTKKAIKQFQKDKGLPVTGELNDTTLQQMKKTSKTQGNRGQAGNSHAAKTQGKNSQHSSGPSMGQSQGKQHPQHNDRDSENPPPPKQ